MYLAERKREHESEHERERERPPTARVLPTPQPTHPYLSGNFAPINITRTPTPCTFTGTIPPDLADGQYVRNGGNPLANVDMARAAHWFDGDGMLTGVAFPRHPSTGALAPEFVNQYVLTDLFLSTISSTQIRHPILPSIATLVDPLAGLLSVGLRILRTIILVLLSHLPGSKQPIRKISVANTNVVYHDGRALATCESGPPMRILLPGLETVGWYDGVDAEGESPTGRAGRGRTSTDEKGRDTTGGRGDATAPTTHADVLGGTGGLLGFMREWTTAHPKIDPVTKEMLMFHSNFAPPYVQYSILPQTPAGPHADAEKAPAVGPRLINVPVPGVSGAKMMHDFGVSSAHTVIMDLPLTLDPTNQLKGIPSVSYDSGKPSRFGVFPRRRPQDVRWFETDASCIFHTANTWDEGGEVDEAVDGLQRTSATAVNMLACRLTSATLVYVSGNIAPPVQKPNGGGPVTAKRRMSFFSKYGSDAEPTVYERAHLLESPDEAEPTAGSDDEDGADVDEFFNQEQCRLYYYRFNLETGAIDHQWALSSIPFEFPSVHPDFEMSAARFVYGCSSTTTSFGSALGKATKIDALVKVNVAALIARGRSNPPPSVTGVVDTRTVPQILSTQSSSSSSSNDDDAIQIFRMPAGWFAQEPRFVPSTAAGAAEDDGFLLFYAFDESQLTASGDVPSDNSPSAAARSELWIVDARRMQDVLARVHLPQRVPYGLHGSWFSAEQIRRQRPVHGLREIKTTLERKGEEVGGLWMKVRRWVQGRLR